MKGQRWRASVPLPHLFTFDMQILFLLGALFRCGAALPSGWFHEQGGGKRATSHRVPWLQNGVQVCVDAEGERQYVLRKGDTACGCVRAGVHECVQACVQASVPQRYKSNSVKFSKVVSGSAQQHATCASASYFFLHRPLMAPKSRLSPPLRLCQALKTYVTCRFPDSCRGGRPTAQCLPPLLNAIISPPR